MREFRLLIDGVLVPGELNMEVLNPATEKCLATAPRASLGQLEQAVAAAKAAFPGWAATPILERKRVVLAIADVIDANAEELARLVTEEQGKPLASARDEIAASAYLFRDFARYELPVELLEDSPTRRVEAHRKPLGVVAAIIAWNAPVAVFAFKVPPALLAGNTLIVKPAPTTPLATLRLGELIGDVVPHGVVNIITDQNELGAVIDAHPDIRKISFTGSVATGKKVMALAAGTLKRLTLELGGNDAAIVLADADPKAVAPKLFAEAFGNTGQVCIALKRLYVHASIYDEVCNELVELARREVVGDGLEQGTTLGPLQNRMQFDKVKAIIADARLKGTIIAGGGARGPGYFIEPTIVRDIAEGARVVDEEQFGPVLPVIKFIDEADAVRRANGTSFGLGASIWSTDPARALKLAHTMEAGNVWINQHSKVDAKFPYGGAKQSGLGVEFGLPGLLEYTQLQIINMAR